MNVRAMKRAIILLSLAALLLLTGAVLANGPPTIERSVLGAGGGRVVVTPYAVLEGTMGQAVVGLDSHAPYHLCSGFRCRAAYEFFLPLVLRDYP
jgi:hypothetical protein